MTEELTFKALVLRETPLGESDKLLTVIADGLGKALISCRGVRSIKSHRLASTQIFCYDEFTVSVKKGRYFLKEATLIENFYSLREDIERLALAQYVAEVTETVCVEEMADNDLLALALNTLYMLSSTERTVYHIKACFEMRLASLIGFMPQLGECAICQKKEDDPLFLDIPGGTLLCSECALNSDKGSVTALSPDVLGALRYITSASPKRIFSFTLDDTLYPELSSVCENYLIYHLEKSFDTLKFFHSLGL